jgi:hypothetical protein
MPDKVSPVIPVKIGGKIFRLKVSLRAVHQFQELTGTDIYRDGIKTLDMHADNFRALVWCCLLPEERELIRMKKIQRQVNKHNVIPVLNSLNHALKLSWPEPDKDKTPAEKSPDKSKPTDWEGLWSLGRQELGLGEEEFWQLTLAQFLALKKRYDSAQEMRDWRTGIIASSILNTIPRTEETANKIFTPADFFPNHNWGTEPSETNEDDIRAHFAAFAMANGAEIVEN